MHIILDAIIISLLALFLVRNKRALNERIEIVKRIGVIADEDIVHHRDWEWRYKIFEDITQFQMACKFWKPIKAFYKDHPCLKHYTIIYRN
jgi:hypothetical protein